MRRPLELLACLALGASAVAGPAMAGAPDESSPALDWTWAAQMVYEHRATAVVALIEEQGLRPDLRDPKQLLLIAIAYFDSAVPEAIATLKRDEAYTFPELTSAMGEFRVAKDDQARSRARERLIQVYRGTSAKRVQLLKIGEATPAEARMAAARVELARLQPRLVGCRLAMARFYLEAAREKFQPGDLASGTIGARLTVLARLDDEASMGNLSSPGQNEVDGVVREVLEGSVKAATKADDTGRIHQEILKDLKQIKDKILCDAGEISKMEDEIADFYRRLRLLEELVTKVRTKYETLAGKGKGQSQKIDELGERIRKMEGDLAASGIIARALDSGASKGGSGSLLEQFERLEKKDPESVKEARRRADALKRAAMDHAPSPVLGGSLVDRAEEYDVDVARRLEANLRRLSDLLSKTRDDSVKGGRSRGN